MANRLLTEIHQTVPFATREVEAFLNLVRTSEALARQIDIVLRPSGLSRSLYNVLRILRGAGGGPLSCRDIGERLVTQDPDVTRLLDRLVDRGLVTRERDTTDRRVVRIRATPEGLALVDDRTLTDALNASHQQQFSQLSAQEVVTLIDLLERLRPPSDIPDPT